MFRFIAVLIAALVVQSANAAWVAQPCAALHATSTTMAAMEHCADGMQQHAHGDCCKDVSSCAQSCGLPALAAVSPRYASLAAPQAMPHATTPTPAVGHSRNLLRPPITLLS